MEFDGWTSTYKVRISPWIDGKHLYINIQYYASGQSLEKPPVWDKTVYITNNDAGRRIVMESKDTLIEGIARMTIEDNTKVVLTA